LAGTDMCIEIVYQMYRVILYAEWWWCRLRVIYLWVNKACTLPTLDGWLRWVGASAVRIFEISNRIK